MAIVTIKTFKWRAEADLGVSVLAGASIRAHLVADDPDGVSGAGWFRVQVDAEHEAEALELLGGA